MKSLYIAVQPVGSKFAKALQQQLKASVVNKIYRVDHQRGRVHRALNRNVFTVTNNTKDKIEQFTAFTASQVSCPKFTTDAARVGDLGKTVFARTLINSTGGKGIVEFEPGTGIATPRAPLYTEYVPKKAEYRVHVFNGQVIDVQQKKKKRDFDDNNRDTRVRNLSNGYVYTRDGIVLPDGLGDLAIAAVAAVGYEYGAVDIIYNEKQNKCYVLEVNSRPGLVGTTLKKYVDALISSYNLQRK